MRGSAVTVGNRYSSRNNGYNNYNAGGNGSRRGWNNNGQGGNNNYNNNGGNRNNNNYNIWNARGGRARDSNNNSNNNAQGTNNQQQQQQEAPPDTEPALRVLSFYEQGSKLAFACYNEDENEIVFEDTSAHNGLDTERIVQNVLLETRPNLILVGNKVVANAPLLECLTTMPVVLGDSNNNNDGNGDTNNQGRRRGEGAENDNEQQQQRQQQQTEDSRQRDNSSSTIPYQLLKSSAFQPQQCRSVILHKLRVLTLMRQPMTAGSSTTTDHDFAHAQNYTASGLLHTTTQPTSNFHSLASVINFDSQTLVRALGSLIIYLRNTAFRLEEGFTVTINSIRRCPASDSFLRLEESTLRTLRIFATDHHPLMANNRSYQKSKEGFSLFTLLDRTKSKSGRERLRQWMAQPLRNVTKIRQRHVGMELFLHPECHPAVSLLLERLSNVGSMDSILLRMQRCCAQPNDFLVLIRMLDASYDIIATLSGEIRERAYRLDRENMEQSMDTENNVVGQEMMQEYPSVAYIDELLRRCHVPVTRNLRERMASIIDEEVTAEMKDHVVIHYGFHEELDRAKETFETLDGELCTLISFALSLTS